MASIRVSGICSLCGAPWSKIKDPRSSTWDNGLCKACTKLPSNRPYNKVQCEDCGVDILELPGNKRRWCVACAAKVTYAKRRDDPEKVAKLVAANRAWRAKHGTGENQRQRCIRLGLPYQHISRQEVGDRDGWVCYCCGEDIDQGLKYPDPMSASLEHIIPLSKRGTHTIENVTVSHLVCNTKRGNKEK